MTFSRLYTLFERGAAALILGGMAVVIALTLVNFLLSLWGVLAGVEGEVNYPVFQRLFDRVLAALIALEIAHSVRDMVMGSHGRAQLRTVVVIGMLAVVRKLVVLDVEATSGVFLAGLAAVIVALAATLAIINTYGSREEPPAAPGAKE